MSFAATSMAREHWVRLGKLGRPHGLKGEIWFYPENPNSETLQPGIKVKIEGRNQSPGGKVIQKVKKTARVEPGRHILLLDGIDSRDAAASYTNCLLFAKRSDFPAIGDGEFYLTDLPGLEVLSRDGEHVAVVKDVLDTPAHSVMVLEAGKDCPDVLVPIVVDWVSEVDVERGIVRLARRLEDLK